MKSRVTVGFLSLLAAGTVAGAGTLKFPPAERIALEAASPQPNTAGLYLSPEFTEFKHTERTSPFDKLHYPVGAHSADLLNLNLTQVFQKVVESATQTPGDGVDLVVVPSIVSFDAVVPKPAWKPHLATVVYRVDVFDRTGEKIFTQTATAVGQTSEGMMSGVKARKLCTTATLMATAKAAKQLLEGLLASEEIRSAK
jgi:hypothetical protein